MLSLAKRGSCAGNPPGRARRGAVVPVQSPGPAGSTGPCRCPGDHGRPYGLLDVTGPQGPLALESANRIRPVRGSVSSPRTCRGSSIPAPTSSAIAPMTSSTGMAGEGQVRVVEVDGLDSEAPQRRLARRPMSSSRPSTCRPPSLSRRKPILVAIVTSSRRPTNARPSSCSLWPSPSTLAVSKNVMPSSTARASVAIDSSSSLAPSLDDIPAQPSPCSDTTSPAVPRRRSRCLCHAGLSAVSGSREQDGLRASWRSTAEPEDAVCGLSDDGGLLGGREPAEVLLKVGPRVGRSASRQLEDGSVPIIMWSAPTPQAHVDEGGCLRQVEGAASELPGRGMYSANPVTLM